MTRIFPFLPAPGTIESRAKRRALMLLIGPLLLIEYLGHGVRSFCSDFRGCWSA
jgi:hypothetical protein